MRAIVTGSSGFVGRHLIPLLKAAAYEVIGIDPKNEDLNSRTCRFQYWLNSDFPEVLEPYDIFIHLAANIQSIDEREKGDLLKYADITLDYCAFDFVRKNPPRKALIYPSSCAIDAAETDAYAYSKTVGERMALALHKQGIPVVILRPFSGTGPGQALSYPMPALIKRAAKKEDPLVVWGSLATVRDWLWIEDLCEAFILAINRFPRGVPIDIGSGIPCCFGELAWTIANKIGYEPKIREDSEKPTSSLRRVANIALAKSHGWTAKHNVEQIVDKCLEAWPWVKE